MADNERRLAAIMFTDMVGYTALGQRNESLSLALVEEQKKVIRPILSRHSGREVKTIGDAFLVEFRNAVDAVRCAYDIQRAVREFNLSLAVDKRIHLRIGVHVGDVVESQGDISGDAVNVASRIEPLAEDGGVCVTSHVYDFVKGKVDLPLTSVGYKILKNVSAPVEVYRMAMPWEQDLGEAKPQLNSKRVAVLPFANMSPDPADEYFADGMTEELIDRLAQVKEIEVIARTSVMSYKKKEKKVSEIATELEAGSVVEGSVRKAGNKVRVTAQLINGATQGHLWSAHYDGNLDDIFAVQSEIAEKVAGELRVRLVESEKRSIEKKPTQNMEAYGYFLRGKELIRAGGEANYRQGLALFEKAVELDPYFARAHVAVATAHQTLATVGYESYDVMIPAVKASLKRALELDPDLAEAHASLALLHLNEDEIPEAELEAKKALELNPSNPEAYAVLMDVAGIKGEPEEMLKNSETAYRLDPVSQNYIGLVGSQYLWAGREEEALEHGRRTEHLAPAQTYRNMVDYYLLKGDVKNAREMHARYERLRPESPWVVYMGGFIDATAGDKEKALEAIKKIEERKMGPISYNHVAYVYYALGDMDAYFENLNRAMEGHTLAIADVMYSPLLAKARTDPRYRELVGGVRRQAGLPK